MRFSDQCRESKIAAAGKSNGKIKHSVFKILSRGRDPSKLVPAQDQGGSALSVPRSSTLLGSEVAPSTRKKVIHMIGLASEIRIKTFTSGYDQELNINNWLEDNPDLVIVDIKFSSSATTDEWSNEAMVIYRIK